MFGFEWIGVIVALIAAAFGGGALWSKRRRTNQEIKKRVETLHQVNKEARKARSMSDEKLVDSLTRKPRP